MIDYEDFKNGIVSDFGEDGKRYVQFSLRGVGELPEDATDEDIKRTDDMLTEKIWDALREMFKQNVSNPAIQQLFAERRQALMFTDRPVFVWPTPTDNGLFIAEDEKGNCFEVEPRNLTFIDSREAFDMYDWKRMS